MGRRPTRLWWVYLDREVSGPFKLEQILRIPGVDEKTRVCPQDTREWRTLGELASAAQPPESPLQRRRCPNPACGRKVHLGSKFCDRCGAALLARDGEERAAASPPKRPAGVTLAWASAVLTAVAFSLWTISRQARRAPAEAGGRIRLELLQLWHAKTVKDVYGDDRRPRAGARWCVARLSVRGAGPGSATFDRRAVQAVDRAGGTVAVDTATAVFPDELRDALFLSPGEAAEGHLLFQLAGGTELDALRYAGRPGPPITVPIPPELRGRERSWRGREDAAVGRLRAFVCSGKDETVRGKTVDWLLKEWKDPLAARARQEQGPVYHVDLLPAPDEDGIFLDETAVFSFHVDIDSGRIGAARDADTLATHNTRVVCLGE